MKMCKTCLFALAYAGMSVALLFSQPTQQSPRNRTPAASASTNTTSQAAAKVRIARMYLEAKDYAAAQASIADAMTTSPDDPQIRTEAESLWKSVLAEKQRDGKATADQSNETQLALLEESERLTDEEKFDAAAALAQKVLSETKDPQVGSRARMALAHAHPTGLGQATNTIWNHYGPVVWIIADLILLGLIVYGLYRVVLSRRQKSADQHRAEWLVFGVDDTTNLGVAQLVINLMDRWRERTAPVSAGLLKLETLSLPSVPQFDLPPVTLGLGPAIEALDLQIHGIKVGAIAKAWRSAQRWFDEARPWIAGIAFLTDSQVVLRLTAHNAGGRRSVSVSANKAQGMDGVATAAEAVTYKMYYLIATQSTTSDAEISERLRGGLDLLGQYVSRKNSEVLRQAYEVFQAIRSERPAFDEVYLYEGIALDLMERHDDAISRFHYLAQPQNTDDANLRERASYNEAISRFRKYRSDELLRAIEILDAIVGAQPDLDQLTASPIKALALAAKANCIAHKPIFWQHLLFNGRSTDQAEIARRKGEARDAVNTWVAEVSDITAILADVHQRAPNSKPWDVLAKRQLKWAIANAQGNIHLNYAMHFLAPPAIPGVEQQAELRNQSLEQAYGAFRDCEILLPPGVETLTNLATALWSLSKTADARSYAQRAIDLNPSYEYAYYRLAQAWEADKRGDKVIEVLKQFPKTPQIPAFLELYRSYYVQPPLT